LKAERHSKLTGVFVQRRTAIGVEGINLEEVETEKGLSEKGFIGDGGVNCLKRLP